MPDSKLEIKVGSITFSGEGSSEWLAKQLDKVLDKLPELLAVASPQGAGDVGGSEVKTGAAARNGNQVTGTLAAFLKSTNASESQPRKFLAAAVWLQDSDNKNRLTTTDVSGALSKHNQGKLANASDCLIKNATKGFCVREGKQFYVTDEGRGDLK